MIQEDRTNGVKKTAPPGNDLGEENTFDHNNFNWNEVLSLTTVKVSEDQIARVRNVGTMTYANDNVHFMAVLEVNSGEFIGLGGYFSISKESYSNCKAFLTDDYQEAVNGSGDPPALAE